MPGLIVSCGRHLKWGDWQWNLANFDMNHQSNGRPDPLSRSWNRLIAGVGVESSDFVLRGRL